MNEQLTSHFKGADYYVECHYTERIPSKAMREYPDTPEELEISLVLLLDCLEDGTETSADVTDQLANNQHFINEVLANL